MGKRRLDLVATDLARSIWRLHGKCESCGTPSDRAQMQGAHIYGVGAFPRLRDDLRNGMCLCAHCHRRYTDAPLEFGEFIQNSWAKEVISPLRLKNQVHNKRFWADRIVELKDIKNAIETGELTIEEARSYEN